MRPIPTADINRYAVFSPRAVARFGDGVDMREVMATPMSAAQPNTNERRGCSIGISSVGEWGKKPRHHAPVAGARDPPDA